MGSSEKAFRVLVVDDEESLREVLTIMLHREGYLVEAAQDGEQAIKRIRESHFDLVISDIKMPKVSGLKLLSYLNEHSPETLVIMITAFSSTDDAVEAMKQGAYDYISKPFQNEEIRLIVRNALEKQALKQENLALKRELGERFSFGKLIGKSKRMQELYSLIERVAGSTASILVTGESGTGKELVAKAIHYNSTRRERPFVPINCGAIAENLLESELFGHEKGSFTGAVQQKQGLFEVANGGTLFLDEIGELPISMQVKLLRVLQEGEIRRVGGTKDIPVDVRVVAATNKQLDQEVAEGHFREDLFFRLNVIPCVNGVRTFLFLRSISRRSLLETGRTSTNNSCACWLTMPGRAMCANSKMLLSAAPYSAAGSSTSRCFRSRCAGRLRPHRVTSKDFPRKGWISMLFWGISRSVCCWRHWSVVRGCAKRRLCCSGLPFVRSVIAWPNTDLVTKMVRRSRVNNALLSCSGAQKDFNGRVTRGGSIY